MPSLPMEDDLTTLVEHPPEEAVDPALPPPNPGPNELHNACPPPPPLRPPSLFPLIRIVVAGGCAGGGGGGGGNPGIIIPRFMPNPPPMPLNILSISRCILANTSSIPPNGAPPQCCLTLAAAPDPNPCSYDGNPDIWLTKSLNI